MSVLVLVALGVALMGAITWSLGRGQPSYGPPVVDVAPMPEPDIGFAAKGYVQVAITRRHAPHIDLHDLELGYATELLDAGCTKEQALAARWGGVCAIADDLANFDDALAAYKKTAVEAGVPFDRTKDDAARMYQAAGLLVMATAHAVDPQGYGHFLRYIGAHG